MCIIVRWIRFILICEKAPESRDSVGNIQVSLKHKLKKMYLVCNLSNNFKSHMDLKHYLEIMYFTISIPSITFHYLWKGLWLSPLQYQYKTERLRYFWWIKTGAGAKERKRLSVMERSWIPASHSTAHAHCPPCSCWALVAGTALSNATYRSDKVTILPKG